MITESGLAKKVTLIQVRSSYLIWISCGSVSTSGFPLVLWLFLIECWTSQVKNWSENLRLWRSYFLQGGLACFCFWLAGGLETLTIPNLLHSTDTEMLWTKTLDPMRAGWTLDHPSLLSDGLSSLRCWPGSLQLGLFNLCLQPCESGKNSAQILSQTSTKTS